MKNILITGGAGYIGSQLAHDLIEKGYNVFVIDDLSTGNKILIPKKTVFIKSDIANYKKVSKLLQDQKINTVIHCAASISVEESMKNKKKYFLNNYLKTKKFINCCLNYNIRQFIFSSTAAVYKENDKNKVSEKFPTSPKNYYGHTKLMCEKFLLSKKNISLFILRYFNVAGADKKLRTGPINNSRSTHLIKKIVQIYFKKKTVLRVFGNNYNTHDGTAIRDYIYISDLSLIHQKCLIFFSKMKKPKKIILNCGYGKGYSVLDVIKSANKIFRFNFSYTQKRKGDLSKIVACNKKLRTLFNFNVSRKIETIINSSILWEKKLLKNVNK